jgi:hypothetical protein
MNRLRQPRRWLELLLALPAIVLLAAIAGSWLPLLFGLPWLGAIVWYSLRDAPDTREPPSAAEAARRRLWTS